MQQLSAVISHWGVPGRDRRELFFSKVRYCPLSYWRVCLQGLGFIHGLCDSHLLVLVESGSPPCRCSHLWKVLEGVPLGKCCAMDTSMWNCLYHDKLLPSQTNTMQIWFGLVPEKTDNWYTAVTWCSLSDNHAGIHWADIWKPAMSCAHITVAIPSPSSIPSTSVLQTND